VKNNWESSPHQLLATVIQYSAASLVVYEVAEQKEGVLSYEEIITGPYINLSRVEEHINFFTQNCTPRITGYPGCDRAAEYIYDKFREYGLAVQYQWYNITIPVDEGGELDVYAPDGALLYSCPVYPLWPNGPHPCSTPPGGLNGSLIYAGEGFYSDYDGHNVNGSIVMLEFNTLNRWLIAPELGAKAVIFVEPYETSASESEAKNLRFVPLNFPRVYLESKHFYNIKDLLDNYSGLNVRLTSEVRWESRKVANVIGIAQGTDFSKEWLILFAHYDSWSVVPSLTEGATSACGIGSLLELARFMTKIDHKRSLLFVAFSGFGQCIAGARAFVNSLVWERDRFPLSKMIYGMSNEGVLLDIGMDLSPESTAIAMFYTSHLYRVECSTNTVPNEFMQRAYHGAKPGFIAKMLSAWTKVYGRTWYIADLDTFSEEKYDKFTPNPFIIDSEAFMAMERGPPTPHAFTFRTAYAWFQHEYTPLDTFSRLADLNNLRPQLEFIFCNIYDLSIIARDTLGLGEAPGYRGLVTWDVLDPTVQGAYVCRVVGQVVEYDPATGYYKPVPNAIVQVYNTEILMYYRLYWFEMTDSEGKFTAYGIYQPPRPSYNYYPYVINQTTGEIIYAPDFGMYGGRVYPHIITIIPNPPGYLGTMQTPRPFPVFKCGNIELYKILFTRPQFPAELSHYAIGRMRATVSLYIPIGISVQDDRNHFTTDFFGYVEEQETAVVFVPPKVPVEIIVSLGTPPTLLALLHNASEVDPEFGVGYTLDVGQSLSLIYTPYHVAREMLYLNTRRYSLTEEKNIFTGAGLYHPIAEENVRAASEALQAYSYGDYYVSVISSAANSFQAYPLIKDNMYYTINTTVIIFAVLIPFAFLAERIIFHLAKGYNRVALASLIMAVCLVMLFLLHPGFTMASNVYLVMFGVAIALLTAPIIFIMYSNSVKALGELRLRLMGIHMAAEARLGSVLVTSMDVGISYMRRRRFRTALMLLTIITLTSVIIMFTSTSGYKMSKPFRYGGTAEYSGLFIRDAEWSMIRKEFTDYLTYRFEGKGTVSARAWAYAVRSQEGYGNVVYGPSGMARSRGFIGLMPSEGETGGWTNYLTPGSRWFLETDYAACIVTAGIAHELGAKVGDMVSVMGYNMTLIGIFVDDISAKVDLDQQPSTIFDFIQGVEMLRFIPARSIMYVPYMWVMEHGGVPFTIMVTLENKDDIIPVAEEISHEMNIYVYAAQEIGKNVPMTLYSSAMQFQLSGYSLVSMPLLIIALNVFNLMLGNIYERRREISTFSSLGLSPMNVALMFLSEFIVFAIVGTVIGYILGILGCNFIYAMKLLPPTFYPNFASTFVFLALGIVMLSISLASIYPFMLASRLVTPSLERRWKIETKPLGDKWFIPTPFLLTAEDVDGILEYFREFFMAYPEEVAGYPFATKSCVKKQEVIDGYLTKRLIVELHVAPFPLAINQEIEIIATEPRWNIVLSVTRLTGKMDEWISVNKRFIDTIRKQLLIWRGITPSTREAYYKRAKGEMK